MGWVNWVGWVKWVGLGGLDEVVLCVGLSRWGGLSVLGGFG